MSFSETLLRAHVRTFAPYTSARDEFTGRAEVFLDANENPFDNGLNRYPDPHQHALKARIAAIKGVDIQHLFLGNGSDECIDLLFRACTDPGTDHAVLLPPTYGMYGVSAALNAVRVREVALSPDFQPDVEAILAGMEPGAKLLFLCSPNNPSGNAFDSDRVEALLRSFPGLVVVDEAYVDFSSQSSWIHRLKEFPNLVVLQTFSKAWGLAGIRLGMAFAHPRLIAALDAIKPPYNLSALTQQAALKALEMPERIREQVQLLLAEREQLATALRNLPQVEMVYPSDANFLLVKIADARTVYEHLLTQAIVVRDRSRVRLCEGCLRITVGTPTENMRLVAALQG